jgi:hypothetical protein
MVKSRLLGRNTLSSTIIGVIPKEPGASEVRLRIQKHCLQQCIMCINDVTSWCPSWHVFLVKIYHSDRGRIGIFYAFKLPKTHWRLCRGLQICFYNKKNVKMTPLICFIHLIVQEYDSKCLKMYLITLKVVKIC